MIPTPLLLLAAAAVGVDTGWTKLDSGGYEYIIQIPPEQLDALRAGGEFGSDLPPDTGAIRSYRIVIGNGPVVNEGVPLPPEARVALKPLVDDAAATNQSKQPNVHQQSFNADPWRRPGGTQLPSPPADEAHGAEPPNGDELDDERFVGLGLNGRRTGGNKPEVRTSDVGKLEQQKNADSTPNEVDSPSDSGEEIAAHEPQTWSRSQFSWTMLVLGLIVCGGLNGYLGWLAIDFRNRYLELLRDLDTQPTEPADSPRDQSDEELADDHVEDSPRELVRSAHTFVGRRESQRRRDREQDRCGEA